MKTTTLTLSALFLAGALTAAADITQEEETEFGGFMKIATFGRNMKTTTRVSGDKMRSDAADSAQIVDLTGEKIYELDTKKKTYRVTTFAEMKKKMEQALAQAKAAPKREGKEAPPQASTSMDVKVSETGNQQTIRGYACKQYLMQMDLKVKDEKSKQEGALESLMELWLTKDAPGTQEIHEFYKKMASKLGTTEIGRQMAAQMSQSSQGAPDSSAAMMRMSGEVRKMEGQAIRTVFYLGSAEAARKEALEGAKKPSEAEAPGEKEEKKEKKGGLGGLLSKMKPPSGGGGEPSGEQQGQPGAVLTKMTMEVVRLDTSPIDPKLFAVPEGYKQVAAGQ